MPEGKSLYDVYYGAGKTVGEYQASLYGVEDVWGRIESSRERAAWKQEQTERTIDTLAAALELSSEVYGGYKAEQDFKGYLGELKKVKGPYQKVGVVGEEYKDWGEISRWKRMWQEPQYKFGEDVYGREDVTIMAQMAKYGMSTGQQYSSPTSSVVESTVSESGKEEFPLRETGPGGLKTIEVGKEVDIGGGSLFEEAGAKEEFLIKEQSGQFQAFNPLSYGEGEEDDDDPLDYLTMLGKGGVYQ